MSNFNGSSLESRSEEERAANILPVKASEPQRVLSDEEEVVRIYATAAVVGGLIGLAVAVVRFFMKRKVVEVSFHEEL